MLKRSEQRERSSFLMSTTSNQSTTGSVMISGDEALKLIVQKIKSEVRDIDLVGRMGGGVRSVFAWCLARSTIAVAERDPRKRIRALLSSQWESDVRCRSASELRRRSPRPRSRGPLPVTDRRLYDAKRNGRNRVKFEHYGLGRARLSTSWHSPTRQERKFFRH